MSLNSCDKVGNVTDKLNEATKVSGGFLSNVKELQKAEDLLREIPLYKGKDIKVFQNVNFYGGEFPKIEIELVNPDNGEEVDHYVFQSGEWSEAQPVQISGDGDMASNTTDLKDIKFTTVATVFDNYIKKKMTLKDEVISIDPNFIYFNLSVPNQIRTWKSSDIETNRAKYNIEFNLDGSVKEFKKK